MHAGAAAASAAAAAIAEAIKASGAIVRLEPDEFRKILYRQESPLVVLAIGGFFRRKYRYLTSYRGFAFFTESDLQLDLPGAAEVVAAGKIWVPG